jgi:UDP-GlcNAc3NAcA epimerase
MKIVTVIGARPQFIKAAAFSREMRKREGLKEVIIHTGQHFDENMSQIFFSEMHIPEPAYNLNINGVGHGAMTGQMLEGIEKILLAEKPDWVLVYGDTNSTLAGVLAAKKLHIRVAHVEAGLRSFNMKMPEEINRILTDRISDLLFCPTDGAVENLKREGFEALESVIIKTGDIMLDAALYYKRMLDENPRQPIAAVSPEKYILATIHRAENTDDIKNLSAIVSALNHINNSMPVLVPLHPRTKKILDKNDLSTEFMICDPVGYLDMIGLISNSKLIITDSGGLQKEASFFNKFSVTMRNETEWVELVDCGFNFITGANEAKIIETVRMLMNREYPSHVNLYGNGSSAVEMCNALLTV